MLLTAACALGAVGAAARAAQAAERLPTAVVITGHDGPFHNWRETSAALVEALSPGKSFQVTLIENPEFLADPKLQQFDLVVLNYCNFDQPGLSAAAKQNFLKYLAAGHGLAIIHFSNGAFYPTLPAGKDADWPEYRKLCRRWWAWEKSGHDNLGRFKVDIRGDHPIAQGLAAFDTEDELYCRQEGTEPITIIATAHCKTTDQDEPMAFVYQYGPARVFQTTLGHNGASIRAAAQLLRRGALWAAGAPLDTAPAPESGGKAGVKETSSSATPLSVAAWADPQLPVTTGLAAWFDASSQDAACKAAGDAELHDGDPVARLYDGSGNGRDLAQPAPDDRPTFVSSANGYRAVRFDGERQYLTVADLGCEFKAATVFVVATPFANAGDYRALLAINQRDANDYETGLTIDQGQEWSRRFQGLNVEGCGFVGAVNLLQNHFDFGLQQRLCVASAPGEGGSKLYANGNLEGQRNRSDSMLHMDRLTLGARYYGPGKPSITGWLEGDVAEVLIYDRLLGDVERAAVESYLSARHDALREVGLPRHRAGMGRPLVKVAGAPPVQMFVPGFAVRQLPVDLTNINNLLYRADGKLVALAYDGNVYLLSDADGDGLEEKVELFWDNAGRIRAPIGMALTPPGYKPGNGLFVASKSKCSLIVDTDGDDKADQEIIVAQGWKEIPHGVDALGVAFDPRDGSVYFGLGSEHFTAPYQIDREGKSNYSLSSERATILRVAPDFKSREIVATGIRFPVAMRFNAHHDLFCTDQEGATWLANGNPLDELLHVQPGRHYGFPPRHPKYLPDVIDEPSVCDYSPQHQSTCGLNFNEPVAGGPVFGPPSWQGNALVCGYSRGKLYRTELALTAEGYVSRNHLLAALHQLTCDACVSPRGELVVCVHSGGPDWGSGPTGKGKLYQIAYSAPEFAQPTVVWQQSPQELHLAFDRPIPPEQLRELGSRISIEFGKHVAAGDRFESMAPGYQVVYDQSRMPRFDLPVLGVSVTADRRELILATAPQTLAVPSAVTLSEVGRPAEVPADQLRQMPDIDLQYDLSGLAAGWASADGTQTWTGWLPHLDLAVAKNFTAGSAAHDRLWQQIQQPGKLSLAGSLSLGHMLRPVVQPNSKIDYELPPEEVTLTFRSNSELQVSGPGGVLPVTSDGAGHCQARLTLVANDDVLFPLELTLGTGKSPLELAVSYHTQEDSRERALQIQRLLVPWARLDKAVVAVSRDVPELKGGNWARGRRVFMSDEAGCAKCHMAHGEGSGIGPNLSNLPQRDYPSVVRDITQPSFSINPDYISQVVSLSDGRVLTGIVRTEGGQLHVGSASGQLTAIDREDVDSMNASAVSIMPEGLPKLLGPEKMKDLLTFLLIEPPHMTDYGGAPPPARSGKAGPSDSFRRPNPPAKTRPLHLTLVTGPKDHGPGEHDYPAWQSVWQRLLSSAADTTVSVASSWPSAENLKTADVLVFYQQGKWTSDRARDIDAFMARGGGLVYIHYAVDGGGDPAGFSQRIGLAWQGGLSKFRHGRLDVEWSAAGDHPIARNFDKLEFHDESYWNLIGDPKRIRVLATGVEDAKPQPLFWTMESGQGRVFVSIPGHFSWTFDDPLFRVLLLRGIAWSAGEPVDRFNDLVPLGARIEN